MRQCVRVKHGYGKEYFFLAKHLYKAAVGNSAYVRGQADIQGTFGQRLFEGRRAVSVISMVIPGYCSRNNGMISVSMRSPPVRGDSDTDTTFLTQRRNVLIQILLDLYNLLGSFYIRTPADVRLNSPLDRIKRVCRASCSSLERYWLRED